MGIGWSPEIMICVVSAQWICVYSVSISKNDNSAKQKHVVKEGFSETLRAQSYHINVFERLLI